MRVVKEVGAESRLARSVGAFLRDLVQVGVTGQISFGPHTACSCGSVDDCSSPIAPAESHGIGSRTMTTSAIVVVVVLQRDLPITRPGARLLQGEGQQLMTDLAEKHPDAAADVTQKVPVADNWAVAQLRSRSNERAGPF